MFWLAVAAVVSTVASVHQSNKSAKAQRRAAEVQQKIDARARKREQMDALRQSQIARAQAVAAGVNSGTTDSSGLQGQVASIQAQTASNVAYTNQVQSGADVVSSYTQQAAGAATKAGNWEALAKLSLTATGFTPAPETTANKPTLK